MGDRLMVREHHIRTTARCQLYDISREVAAAVTESGGECGVCHIFVPHTTAAVTINENADPDVQHDIIRKMGSLLPQRDGYRHAEGNSDAHIKASLFGFSEQIIVEAGQLVLGTWQGIYFCEFDGPRRRRWYSKIVPG